MAQRPLVSDPAFDYHRDEVADARPSTRRRLWSERPWIDDDPMLSKPGEPAHGQIVSMQNLRVIH